MRLDKFLQSVGIVKRRTKARELCQRGLVLVDGARAKPAKEARAGQEIEVRLGASVRTYRVLAVPERVVAKSERESFVRLEHSRALQDEF
ncbi:MAG: S4 domain-containing protein [Armatimonadota bacterium]